MSIREIPQYRHAGKIGVFYFLLDGGMSAMVGFSKVCLPEVVTYLWAEQFRSLSFWLGAEGE